MFGKMYSKHFDALGQCIQSAIIYQVYQKTINNFIYMFPFLQSHHLLICHLTFLSTTNFLVRSPKCTYFHT